MKWTARSSLQGQFRKFGLASALAVLAVLGPVVQAKGPTAAQPVVAIDALPQQARVTLQLIRTGGPFPYGKDGIVFGNREHQLPRRERGFYHEYTVPTPGARDRGARRIVCGGSQPLRPEACFYSDDHYASFRLIAQ